MSLSCWVTHLQRSWDWRTPLSTRARPIFVDDDSSASSSCRRLRNPSRTITSPSRSAGSSELAPRTSPSLKMTDRSPFWAWTLSTPVQRDWFKKAIRSEVGKAAASPTSTARGGAAFAPIGGTRSRQRRSDPVGAKTKRPARARSSFWACGFSGVTVPLESMLNHKLMFDPFSVGCPAVLVGDPLDLIFQRALKRLGADRKLVLAAIDEEGGSGVDSGAVARFLPSRELVGVLVRIDRLRELRNRQADLAPQGLDLLGVEPGLVLEEEIVHLPELVVIPREERRLRRRGRVGVAERKRGEAEAKRRRALPGKLFEDRPRRGAMRAREVGELHRVTLASFFPVHKFSSTFKLSRGSRKDE